MRNLIAFVFISLVIHPPFSFAQVHPAIHIRMMNSDFQGGCDSLVITCESGNKLVPRVLSINGRSLPLMKADNTAIVGPGYDAAFWNQPDNRLIFQAAEGSMWEVVELSFEVFEWGMNPSPLHLEFFTNGELVFSQVKREVVNE
ncbi:MAG: hypothetical protein HQ591_02070 [candidate division Zixibacteria bacterium]|nr:hypothetical protein [Candidatus Tariuqbacter arcticus]